MSRKGGSLMGSTEWENENKIDIRTKVAIKMLFFIFKVLAPYRFEHQFKADLEKLQKEIDSL